MSLLCTESWNLLLKMFTRAMLRREFQDNFSPDNSPGKISNRQPHPDSPPPTITTCPKLNTPHFPKATYQGDGGLESNGEFSRLDIVLMAIVPGRLYGDKLSGENYLGGSCQVMKQATMKTNCGWSLMLKRTSAYLTDYMSSSLFSSAFTLKWSQQDLSQNLQEPICILVTASHLPSASICIKLVNSHPKKPSNTND